MSKYTSSKKFIVLLGWGMSSLGGSWSYQSSFGVQVPSFASRHFSSNLAPVTDSKSEFVSRVPVSYNLGVGKHGPVVKTKALNEAEASPSLEHTVRFLVEHDAVYSIKPPSYTTAGVNNSHSNQSTQPTEINERVNFDKGQSLVNLNKSSIEKPSSDTRNKTSTPIIPRSLLSDQSILRIHHVRPGKVIGDTLAVAYNHQFDVNTPWVEMLINEQRLQLATAHAWFESGRLNRMSKDVLSLVFDKNP